MKGLLKTITGDTLERRFVFVVSVLVTIALIALMLVVVQYVYREIWMEIGARTMVRLTGFSMALEGRSEQWAERLLTKVNDFGIPNGSLMFIWMPGGRMLKGSDAGIPRLDARLLDTRKGPRAINIDGRDCLYWTFPLRLSGACDARLVIAHFRDVIRRRLWAMSFRMLLVSVVMIILSYFIGRRLATSVLSPMNRFSRAMRRVAMGEYPRENEKEDIEDMGHWAETFNLMVRQLHEKHTLERLLHEREKMASLGMLAASVAHEIRNPLAAINSLTQLIAELHKDDSRLAEYTEVVLGEVVRLNNAVEQLLSFSRPLKTSFDEVELSSVLAEVTELLEFEASQADVTIERDFDTNAEIPVLGDRDQLKQVFINLVSNAINAMRTREGGVVSIALCFEPEMDRAEVIVADDGPGVSPDVADKIFDPFFSTRRKGIGLGLAICRKIVNAHGGEIRFENRTARGGAIFSVVLPCGAGRSAGRVIEPLQQAGPRRIE